MMLDPGVPFLDIVKYTKPYLILRSISGTAMTIGHVAFAINFFRIVEPHHFHFVGPTLFTTRRNWKQLMEEEKRLARELEETTPIQQLKAKEI
jgi:cytochrome c oxidase cbb3-type subunit 1